jgi:hypothetical protein
MKYSDIKERIIFTVPKIIKINLFFSEANSKFKVSDSNSIISLKILRFLKLLIVTIKRVIIIPNKITLLYKELVV